MAINDNAEPNRHVCKMQLYEHHFSHAEHGKYIARPSNERTLSMEEIVADMISLDGYPGSRDAALDTIRSFNRVVRFRLSDGFKVNDGRTISYLKLTGTFDAPCEPSYGTRHKMMLKHWNTRESREFAEGVKAEITGIAAVGGQIYLLEDMEEPDAPHNVFRPGNMVHITGEKIRITGAHPDCGVYFVPEGGSGVRVKMTRIGENTAGKIVGIAPDSGSRFCRIEIVTQFSGGTTLKEPRVITSAFAAEAY